jgi:predicted nucleotidyltransferase
MTAATIDDPVLTRVRGALDTMYGRRIERVVLYGSRARGDAQEDSDYDVAVFLRDMPDFGVELFRLAGLSSDILFDELKIVHAMPWPAGAWRGRTPTICEPRGGKISGDGGYSFDQSRRHDPVRIGPMRLDAPPIWPRFMLRRP